MKHLYLRTMESSRHGAGYVTWLLTVSESQDLDAPTRLFSGVTEVSDEQDVTPARVLDDAYQVYARWLVETSGSTLELF